MRGYGAGDKTATPGRTGGYSPLLNTPVAAFGGKTYYQLLGITGLTPGQEPQAGTVPGGGRVGAVLLNPMWIKPGSVDTARSYNHYSPLRTFEDLLRSVWRCRRAQSSRLRGQCV